jgi:NAD(P)-dependent dehydrogenase (short-subunit alcohol dehydrogenase family)
MGKLLTGKVAVITGSTQGLGAAIATLYVKEGAKVVVTGLSATDGKAVAKRLGKNAIFEQTNLVRVDDCRRLIEVAITQFGKVDILVNNAVDATRATVDDVTPVFDGIFALNLRAPLLLARRDHVRSEAPRRHHQHREHQCLHGRTLAPVMPRRRARCRPRRAGRQLPQVRQVRVYCVNCGLDGHREANGR